MDRSSVETNGLSARLVTIAFAMRRLDLSSPKKYSIFAISLSGDVFTRSAALGPLLDIRMSKGPSFIKEKPREASSICIEERPRSNTMPSKSDPYLPKLENLSL